MNRWKRRRGFEVVAGLILLIFYSACSENPNPESNVPPGALGPLKTITLTMGGVEVETEVARTETEQQQGLMYRESMPENHGMLFVYPEPRYMFFWMKNTKIPLAIAFIREDGVVGNIEEMKPAAGPFDPLEHYASKYKSRFALEMNRGWFERHGVKEGDRIEIPLEAIQRLGEGP